MNETYSAGCVGLGALLPGKPTPVRCASILPPPPFVLAIPKSGMISSWVLVKIEKMAGFTSLAGKGLCVWLPIPRKTSKTLTAKGCRSVLHESRPDNSSCCGYFHRVHHGMGPSRAQFKS